MAVRTDPDDMNVMPLPSSSIDPVTVYGEAATPGNAFEFHPLIDVPDDPKNWSKKYILVARKIMFPTFDRLPEFVNVNITVSAEYGVNVNV